jgi:hypothetical protein
MQRESSRHSEELAAGTISMSTTKIVTLGRVVGPAQAVSSTHFRGSTKLKILANASQLHNTEMD